MRRNFEISAGMSKLRDFYRSGLISRTEQQTNLKQFIICSMSLHKSHWFDKTKLHGWPVYLNTQLFWLSIASTILPSGKHIFFFETPWRIQFWKNWIKIHEKWDKFPNIEREKSRKHFRLIFCHLLCDVQSTNCSLQTLTLTLAPDWPRSAKTCLKPLVTSDSSPEVVFYY